MATERQFEFVWYSRFRLIDAISSEMASANHDPDTQSGLVIRTNIKGLKTMADRTEAHIFDNGPIKVSGNFVLKDGKGQEFDLTGRDAVALCRCGHSRNKPFCDGQHKANDFESVTEAR